MPSRRKRWTAKAPGAAWKSARRQSIHNRARSPGVGDNGEARRRNELERDRGDLSGAGGRVGRLRSARVEGQAGRLFPGHLGEGRVLPFHSLAGGAGGLPAAARAIVSDQRRAVGVVSEVGGRSDSSAQTR